MARIRLYIQQSLRTSAEPILDQAGTERKIPFLRVFGIVRIGLPGRAVTETVIDTGAPLTVFPRAVWRRFERHVEWIRLNPNRGEASWLCNLRGRTGGSSKCRVGRVLVQPCNLERPPRVLPATPVLGQFEEEDAGDDRVITGLYGGILEGRRLLVESARRVAWLGD